MKDARAKLFIQATVSFVLLGAGLFVFITSDDDRVISAAAGWVGVVTGYWLK